MSKLTGQDQLQWRSDRAAWSLDSTLGDYQPWKKLRRSTTAKQGIRQKMRRQELVHFQYEQIEHTMVASDYRQVAASLTDSYCGLLLWFFLFCFCQFFHFWIVFNIIYFFKKGCTKSRNISLDNMKSSKISEFLNFSSLQVLTVTIFYCANQKIHILARNLHRKKTKNTNDWNGIWWFFILLSLK